LRATPASVSFRLSSGCGEHSSDYTTCVSEDAEALQILANLTILFERDALSVVEGVRLTRLPLRRYTPGCVLGYGYWRQNLPRTVGGQSIEVVFGQKLRMNAWLRCANKYLSAVLNYDCQDEDPPFGMARYLWETFAFLDGTGEGPDGTHSILPRDASFDEAIARALVLDDYINGLNSRSSAGPEGPRRLALSCSGCAS